jgi:hypothetical protein
VFALPAGAAGATPAASIERLLAGWRERGCEIVALRRLFESLEPARLPRHVVAWSGTPGRPETLARQGAQFLA